MQYQIQTAPLWEVYETHNGRCPLCELYARREKRLIGSYLGENVMDPDFRQRSNAYGFCPDHLRMMYAGENKLGLALQLETRARFLYDLLEKAPADKKSATKKAEELERHIGCVICAELDSGLERYYMTVAQMYGAEREFPELFAAAAHCLKHACGLYAAAKYAEKKAAEYSAALTHAMRRELKRTENELRGFADCFDHNCAARPDPDALPRAAALLITDRIK